MFINFLKKTILAGFVLIRPPSIFAIEEKKRRTALKTTSKAASAADEETPLHLYLSSFEGLSEESVLFAKLLRVDPFLTNDCFFHLTNEKIKNYDGKNKESYQFFKHFFKTRFNAPQLNNQNIKKFKLLTFEKICSNYCFEILLNLYRFVNNELSFYLGDVAKTNLNTFFFNPVFFFQVCLSKKIL